MFINNYVGNHLGQLVDNSLGDIPSRLRGDDGVSWDKGLHRPYFDKNDRPAVTINTGRTTLVKGVQVPIREHVLIRDLVNEHGIFLPVFNATTLRKEEWIHLDERVHYAARWKLRAYADLASMNTYGGFDGMSVTQLESETMNDPGEALVDMDGLAEGRNDAPLFGGQGLPLPITHSDFWMSARKDSARRNGGMRLSTIQAEASARRVAESIEKTTIGVQTGIVWGDGLSALTYDRPSAVYGYINFPARMIKTDLRRPGTATYTPAQTIEDILACLQLMRNAKFNGPYMVYLSNDWDTILDTDYILTGGNVATQTLRQRLTGIEGIQGIKRLDFLFGTQLETNPASANYKGPGNDVDVVLSPYRMVIVQMTPDVARAVDGMAITTLQWDTKGGMQKNFKILCIQVPQLFADFYGNCGILDATSSA